MDLVKHCPLVVATTLLAFALIIFTTLILNRYKTAKKLKLAPVAGGGWPIIGHLPNLHPSKLPHKVLSSMANEYGPIFRISIGVHQAVVISSSDLAKECLSTNDKAASGRPKSIAAELMSYNYAAFGFCSYGPYWRTMRKIGMFELLSNHRVSVLSYVWISEINMFLKNMYDTWNIEKNESGFVLVDMKKLFGDMALQIMLRIVSSKQSSANKKESVRIQNAIRMFFKSVGSFIIGDAIPFLRCLDLGREEKVMKRVFADIDDILEGWLKEHKEKRNDVKGNQDQDFMDVMLSVLDHDAPKDCNYDADTINKATCLTMIAGGTDTTTVTLTWALTLLMNNPEALKKAKEELTLVVGNERQVTKEDIPKLEYLQAIVKETFRLYPAGPLMAPREFIDDCTINDYNVVKGTRLIVNLHKIFRDPMYWESPTEFRPERFLGSDSRDIDFTGRHFEFFPFGAGRRICPGSSFALQVVHLTLANVLHGFKFFRPNDAPIDMSESFGLTNMKKEPLNLLISPALSSNVYAED
ncbi:hypothetical protein RND81_06G239400 [Saponaria officinalis]|uniref:Cytochrome P450 n=1 Tax=Saponaria officinalis TaxID=3572 RepID=A0AAW1KE96_SAPOF